MTRHKWRKRILLLLATALALSLAAGLTGVCLYRATPSWYARGSLTPRQAKDAANQADQKLAQVFSWAAAAQAQWIRRSHGGASNEPPVGPLTVSFNAQEINSFLLAWDNPEPSALEQKLSCVFSGGRLALQDGQVIVAGQSSELGAIVSAEFSTGLDAQGRLRLSLDALTAGRLPVPLSAVAQPLARLRRVLEELLAAYQPSANIDQTLTANGPAIVCLWTRMMLNSLNHQSSDPVLCIPFYLGDLRRALPVKVTAIKLAEDSVTLTLQPLGPEDRQSLLEHLKQPYSQTAPPEER